MSKKAKKFRPRFSSPSSDEHPSVQVGPTTPPPKKPRKVYSTTAPEDGPPLNIDDLNPHPEKIWFIPSLNWKGTRSDYFKDAPQKSELTTDDLNDYYLYPKSTVYDLRYKAKGMSDPIPFVKYGQNGGSLIFPRELFEEWHLRRIGAVVYFDPNKPNSNNNRSN